MSTFQREWLFSTQYPFCCNKSSMEMGSKEGKKITSGSRIPPRLNSTVGLEMGLQSLLKRSAAPSSQSFYVTNAVVGVWATTQCLARTRRVSFGLERCIYLYLYKMLSASSQKKCDRERILIAHVSMSAISSKTKIVLRHYIWFPFSVIKIFCWKLKFLKST